MSDETTITYNFKFPKAREPVSLCLRFNQATFALIRETPADHAPDWTRLDNHKCGHCPLNARTRPFCPAATALNDVIECLDVLLSHEQVETTVVCERRTVIASTSVQCAFGSLFGIIIPTCGCPRTAYLRPMARFHLPFANEEETIYRAASMYLLAQYFAQRHIGSIPMDLAGLERIYQNMHEVNMRICDRLREVCVHDSSSNAIVILDIFSMVMRSAIQRDLKRLEPLFTIFLDEQ